RGGGGGPAAVGDGPHDGYRLGQAALSRAPARARRARAGEVEERGADLPARRLPRRLMRLDVNAFLGAYPWRHVPGTSPDALVRAMNRAGIDVAWASYLPAVFWRRPMEGNAWLYAAVEREPRLRPVPAVHPGLPGWEASLAEAADHGAPAAAIRTLVRSDGDLRLIVTHGDRALIEEVHFGATPDEAARMWWDISWLWGPPEDHLATLVETVGAARLVFGTGQPLRLPEAAVAKLDLLDLAPEQRAAIEADNVRRGLA